MDDPHADHDEQVFDVIVGGDLSPALLAELGVVEVSAPELRTVLSGQFRDQSELSGFLARLRMFALEIVEVRRLLPSTHQPVSTGGPTLDETS